MGRPALKSVPVAAPAAASTPQEDWDAPAAPTADAPVRVRCIIHTHPHTLEKGLAFGEEAVIPQHVADLMLGKGQVEVVT